MILSLIGCQPKETRYVHYHNERFGFELDYPSYMTKDPPPENGDGIRCQGKGLELNAYGGMDLRWMELDDLDPNEFDSYPQDSVFYFKSFVDTAKMVHCVKSARFPNTDNGDIILTLSLTYPQGQVDSTVIEDIIESFCLKDFKPVQTVPRTSSRFRRTGVGR